MQIGTLPLATTAPHADAGKDGGRPENGEHDEEGPVGDMFGSHACAIGAATRRSIAHPFEFAHVAAGTGRSVSNGGCAEIVS